MSKHILEDMVKVQRQRKDTIIKKPKEKKIEFRANEVKEMREERRNNEVGTNYTKGRSRHMLWSVALISVMFCLFALSFLFSKAEIRVNPKVEEIILNENLLASKNPSNDILSFDLVIISGEESKTVQAGELENVSIKAKGIVVIYNAFSSAAQRLDIDTRLEGSNGKIYKTEKQIVVPGMKDDVPGSVEVGIYGAEAGEEYNSVPLDFKIFGFKGTPKYPKFYGRSKGEITGGFIGKIPAISDAEKTTAANDLKIALQEKLLQKATIPGELVLFKDAIFLNTSNINNEPNILSTYNDDHSATLTLRGTLYGLLFNEQKLTKKIAKNKIEKYDESEIFIPNIEDLTFKLTNQDAVSLENVKNISFNLSGPAKVVWKLDVNKFIADLLGKSKKDFNQILSQYENINSANLTIRPVWKRSIPDQAEDVKVIVNYPE